MRVALVSHGFPPYDRTGVENYTAALASTLAENGHVVNVFAPRRADLPELSIRRKERDGYAIHWLTTNRDPADPGEALERPGVSRRFGEFLDRERPDVVHFQHVVKLGVGLLLETGARGIPVIYTAHDYYSICHRYTLLKPDLSPCDIRGDAMLCAQCDVGLEILNEHEELGDYQMGVLKDQLKPAEWARLRAVLEGDEDVAGVSHEHFDVAFDRRQALDAERARGFAAVDRFIAPTTFLRDELVGGGVEPDRIQVLPYGIENDDLRAVPAVSVDGTRPIRFGFFGGLSKHKGVQLLIEAFAGLDTPAELSIWGYSTDAAHVERLRESAIAAGVRWRGGYERAELPELLAEVDVVVVPSIWVENYPIVIREAFSAGRPVVAWRFGALAESVEDGVDGLLVEPFDVDTLRCALGRLSTEPELVRRLAAGIQPVKTMATQAEELASIYAELLELRRKREALPPPLASLKGFVARHDALQVLPTRELFGRVLRGLDGLRKGFGGEVERLEPGALLERALNHGTAVQDALREERGKNEWLEKSLEGTARSLGERARESEWRRESLEELRPALKARDEEIAWRVEELRSREKELAWRIEELEKRDEELAWRTGEMDARDKEIVWRTEEMAKRDAQLEKLGEREEELVWLRDQRRSLEAECEHLTTEQEQLEASFKTLLDRLEATVRPELPPGQRLPEIEGEPGDEGWWQAQSERCGWSAELLEREVLWRREEMKRAGTLSRYRPIRFLLKRLGLGKRLARWEGDQ